MKKIILFILTTLVSSSTFADKLTINDQNIFIDENGYIRAVMPKVKPDTNADEILAILNG